ncbi:MAG: T9SS type A sorting domain-containing protein [Saprospiraceae bacterium]
MRKFNTAFANCLFFLFCATVLQATSIVPYPNLAITSDNSDAVVLARAVQKSTTQQGDFRFQDAQFQVIEPVKGTFQQDDMFTVRAKSYGLGDYDFDIAGDFAPEPGKKYLLFLRQKAGVWEPVMLSYYVFEQVVNGADEYLVPIGGRGIEVISPAGMPPIEPLMVYHSAPLLESLQQYQQTPGQTWNASSARAELLIDAIPSVERSVPTGCDFMLGNSSYLARWEDAAVPIYYDDSDVPTDWSSIYFPDILAALGNYTGISPSDAGPVSFDPDCSDGAVGTDFINFCLSDLNGTQSALIFFDDPCDEIPPLSGCSGTLAFGGSYTSSSVQHMYDGQNWRSARYGYVVVNEGVESCLSTSQYEQVLTHELTHVYRMDHLDPDDYPDNNMNPSCCNAINTKDMECMDYAYDISLPVTLSSFQAKIINEHEVELSWVTQSEKDNEFFSIERSADGIHFDKLIDLAAQNSATGGSYHWLDRSPFPGTNYYRLSQTDFDDQKAYLGIESVELKSDVPQIRVMPNPVAGNTLEIRCDFPYEFDGILEIIDQNGRILSASTVALGKGSNWISKTLTKLPSGVYAIKLYDSRQQWSMRFVKNSQN